MTLSKEKELVDLLVKKLKGVMSDNVQVVASSDFSEERKENVIVVGINNTAPSHPENPAVPDYDYSLQIIVDCFIDSDKQGVVFNQIKEQLSDYIEVYLTNRSKLPELFEDIPVVGFFLEGTSNSVTEDSNKCIFGFRVIVSY